MPGNEKQDPLGLGRILADLDQVLSELSDEGGASAASAFGAEDTLPPTPVQTLVLPPEVPASKPELPAAAVPSAPPAPLEPAPPAAPDLKPAFSPPRPPADAPAEQVRRIAFAFAPPAASLMEKFVLQLIQIGQKSSQRPLWLAVGRMEEFEPGSDLRALVREAKEAGCVALILVVASEELKRDVDALLSDRDVFIKSLTIEEIAKRSVSVDLIVDLLLLRPSSK